MPLIVKVRSTAYGNSPYKRFENVRICTGVRTVVKTKNNHDGNHLLTVAKITWSKYKIINWVKRQFIRIKYM